MEELHSLASGRGELGAAELGASVRVYCNGDVISFVIDVRDPELRMGELDEATDQVQIWMALPPSAYPESFNYEQHPTYIRSRRDRQEGRKTRLFGAYLPPPQRLDLAPFLSDYDYPGREEILARKLKVPAPRELEQAEVHYGLVHYAFYVDGRPPRLLDGDAHEAIGDLLGIGLGDWRSGVKYTVDYLDDGYTLNVQVAREALGVVPVPQLHELRFMVDVVDARGGEAAIPRLTTTERWQAARPTHFNELRFAQPLQTNALSIPNQVFEESRFFPHLLYTDRGWLPVGIDTDGLVYQEFETSKHLTETTFFRQPLDYETFFEQGYPVESLKTIFQPVNSWDYRKEFLLVDGKFLTATEWPLADAFAPGELRPRCFTFPDGAMGMIIKRARLHDPYGWGNCGDCLEEMISIYRVEAGRKMEIFRLQQGHGEQAYCQLNEQVFEGYLTTGADWVKDGKMLVFRLDNPSQRTKKRVKVSWNSHGERVKVEEVY